MPIFLNTLITSVILFFATIVMASSFTGVSAHIKDNLYQIDNTYFTLSEHCDIPSPIDSIINNTGYFIQTNLVFSGSNDSTIRWETTVTSDEGEHVVVNSCYLTGILSSDKIINSCNEDYPIYSLESNYYYIYNTHLYQGFKDTGITIPEVILKYRAERDGAERNDVFEIIVP